MRALGGDSFVDLLFAGVCGRRAGAGGDRNLWGRCQLYGFAQATEETRITMAVGRRLPGQVLLLVADRRNAGLRLPDWFLGLGGNLTLWARHEVRFCIRSARLKLHRSELWLSCL